MPRGSQRKPKLDSGEVYQNLRLCASEHSQVGLPSAELSPRGILPRTQVDSRFLKLLLFRTMTEPHHLLRPKQTLLLILLPMLATFVSLRLYLHLVHVRHIYPGGYLVHHLFLGVLITVPAAFILAFGPPNRLLALSAPASVGIGAALMLDEVTYLVATKATDQDYVSRLSLAGASILIFLAAALLLALYRSHRDQA